MLIALIFFIYGVVGMQVSRVISIKNMDSHLTFLA